MNVSKEATRGASLPFVLVSLLVCDDNGLRLFSQWTSEDEEVAVRERARRLHGADAGMQACRVRAFVRVCRLAREMDINGSCGKTPTTH